MLAIAALLAWVLIHRAQLARQRAIAGTMKAGAARIEFHADGTVSRVDTTSMLVDEIDATAISKLIDLKWLNVNHSELVDEDLRQLCRELDLQALSIVGTDITDESAAALGSQLNLRFLDLRATLISDTTITLVARLRHLKELRLAQTWITDEGLRRLAPLSKLETLDLRYTQVTDEGLAALGECPSLRTVRLTGAQVSERGLDRLRNKLPNVHLDFKTHDIPQQAIVWPKERRYHNPKNQPRFVATEREIGESLEAAGASLRVQRGFILSIGLVNQSAPPDVFAQLKRLRFLKRVDFCGSNAGDQALDSLRFCPCLQILNLQATPVTDVGMASVGRMRSLSSLHLRGTQITDEGVGRLSELRVLGSLVLGDTRITGQSLKLIPDSPFLLGLDVSDTQVKGEDLDIIRDRFSRHLNHLSVANLRITDEHLQSLSEMKYLRTLDISGTSVTDAGLAALPRLRNAVARRTAVTSTDRRKLGDTK